MKILAELTGQFLLLDPHNGALLEPYRPHVMASTHFISQRSSLGHIKILATNLSEDATDAEFATYWAESAGDRELAINSFLAAFGPKPEKTKKSNK